MLSRGTYCCEALSSYCILRIYSATLGYNVVLCYRGMYRDGEEGHIGVRIRTDMEFNNQRNVFAHDESLKLSSL